MDRGLVSLPERSIPSLSGQNLVLWKSLTHIGHILKVIACIPMHGYTSQILRSTSMLMQDFGPGVDVVLEDMIGRFPMEPFW